MYDTSWIFNLVGAGFGIVGIIIIIIYALSTAFLGQWLAEKKGYSKTSWFWICLFFGILGLIAIAGAPIAKNSRYKSELVNEIQCKEELKPGEEKCPHCGGYYDFAFRKCPYCGKERNNGSTSLSKNEEVNETYNIKCYKCNRVIRVDGKIADFKQYICPYCNNKITDKNVLFSE